MDMEFQQHIHIQFSPFVAQPLHWHSRWDGSAVARPPKIPAQVQEYEHGQESVGPGPPPAALSSLRNETTDWFSSFFILTAEVMHLFDTSAVISRPGWCGMGRLKLSMECVRSMHDQNFTKGIKTPKKPLAAKSCSCGPPLGN